MTNGSLRYSPRCFPVPSKSNWIKTHFCIGVVFLAGCTATQVRWDAANIRKQVMVYYNDQIMDNLVREKNELPFVHVDIGNENQGPNRLIGEKTYGNPICGSAKIERLQLTIRANSDTFVRKS